MYSLEINSNNIETLNSVLYYSYTFLKDSKHFELGTTTNNGKVFFKIGVGNYEFIYKNNKINLRYYQNEVHPPLDLTPNYNFFSIATFKCVDLSTIEDFVENSVNFYKNEILKEKIISDKINVFTLVNGNWILFNKLKKRSINTIYLPNNKNIETLNLIKNFLRKETIDLYDNSGILYKKNFILNGPPGTGKTSLIISVASELNLNLYFLTFDKNINDSNFLRIIKNIKENSILVLEDANYLFSDKKNIISLMSLLNILDGIAYKHGLIIFITTNNKDTLCPSLMRSGRIDHILEFENIKIKESQKMIDIILSNFGNVSEKDKKKFMELLPNYSITPAELQQYLINNINNINKNIELLKEKTVSHNYYH